MKTVRDAPSLIGSGSYAGGWPAFEASNSVGMNCLPGIRTSGVDSVASFLATSGSGG